jgi:UDP-N-acetylmuramate--alanine ligase
MVCQKENLLEVVDGSQIEVLLTLGAGDIDQFVDPIRNLLNKRIC